jgi:uncharacterized protein (TIGR02453 family)
MIRRFAGFPPDAIKFFKDLSSHNNREWFQAHKDLYERACRKPMNDLLEDLGPRFGAGRVSRINRDIRFSADKSPYRTNISAGIGGSYISLSTEGLYVGAGIYKPETAALQRLRAAIDNARSGAKLQQTVKSLRRKGYRVDTHETLTGAPRGYPVDHPRIDLLRMKDIFAGKMFEPAAWLSTSQAEGRIQRVLTDLEPLRDWLRRYVGGRSDS